MATLHQEARSAWRELGFTPSKARGQNFLVHQHVIDTILRLLDLGEDDRILEVGPGLGFVTRRLVGESRRVWAIEVDPLLVQWLRNGPLGSSPEFHLVHGDVLETDFDRLLPQGRIKAVANLPYSVAARRCYGFLRRGGISPSSWSCCRRKWRAGWRRNRVLPITASFRSGAGYTAG